MSQGQFNKQKTYSLILGILALVGMILPWVKVSFMGFSSSANGFNGEGYISLLGIAAVAVGIFLNGPNNAYDNNGRLATLVGFGAIIAGAVIVLIQVLGKDMVGMGIGLILTLATGVIGLLLMLGKITPPKSIDEKIDKL